MKRLLTALLITTSFTLFSQGAMAGRECIGHSVVSYMHAGGPYQGGNHVWVAFRNINSGETVKISLNPNYNLDDAKGKALFSLLTLSMTADKVLKVTDNYGDNCDDFDEIRIYN